MLSFDVIKGDSLVPSMIEFLPCVYLEDFGDPAPERNFYYAVQVIGFCEK